MASTTSASPSSVLDQANDLIRQRLEELDDQLAAIRTERDGLRKALKGLGRNGASPPAPISAPSPAGETSRSRGTTAKGNGRAPRGAAREQVLRAIGDTPKTAGEIATETGVNRNTVSTTLTKLVANGTAIKATRGYQQTDSPA